VTRTRKGKTLKILNDTRIRKGTALRVEINENI
jgi:hypothetical protein